jgi:hypothetical protein
VWELPKFANFHESDPKLPAEHKKKDFVHISTLLDTPCRKPLISTDLQGSHLLAGLSVWGQVESIVEMNDNSEKI